MIIDLSNTFFVKNLRFLRSHYCLSRRALSRLTGISQQTIKGIEEETIPPAVHFESYRRLSRVFEVETNDLAKTDLARFMEH